MKSTLLGLAGAGAIGALGICDFCLPAANAAVPVSPVVVEVAESHAPVFEPKQVSLRIEGMTCGGCALSVRLVLERLEGVAKTVVDYDKKLAVVTYDAAKVKPEQMIGALKEKLGYTAKVVEEKTS